MSTNPLGTRRVWAATHVGHVRHDNEDRVAVPEWTSSGGQQEFWTGDLDLTGGWAVIADGMGGHEAGELAAQAVVDAVREYAGTCSTEREVRTMVERANARVFERMHLPGGRPGMGSTVAGVVLHDGRGWVFNLGDSRVYRAGAAIMDQLSLDDTWSASVGRRSHSLTQCLGGTRRPVPLAPHIRFTRFHPGDLLLLCSDGLTDMLSEEDIAAVLAASLGHPANALVDAALGHGGEDNVSVVVIGPAGPGR